MAVRIGRWDCESCGFVGNAGPDTKCSKCGSPRPANVKFYLPAESDIVTDENSIRSAKSGANWVCSYCQAHNTAADLICKSCGSPNTPQEEHDKLQEKEYNLDEVPTSSDDVKRKQQTPPTPPKKSRKWLKILGIIVGVILFFIFLTTFESDIDVKVDQKLWSRTIKIEKFDFVTEEDWSLPAEAQLLESFDAVHHYDKVSRGYETKTRTVQVKVGEEKYVSGQKDLGNGYFEDVYSTRPIYEDRTETYEEEVFEDVPVYQTKYRYKIKKWAETDPLVASGSGDAASYPQFSESLFDVPARAIDTVEVYKLIITDHSGEKQEEECDFAYWQQTKEGGTVKARKSSVFGTYYGLKTEKE